MNRLTVCLLAALEAFIVVALGIVVPLVPLTLLWGVQYGFSVDWVVFWRAAVDIWALGNGVDLTVALDEATLSAVGIEAAEAPFVLTLAPLGFALLTVLLGVRTGRRAGEAPHGLAAIVAAIATFAVLSGAAVLSAQNAVANPSAWQGFVLPPAVFAFGVIVGAVRQRLRDDAPGDRVSEIAGALRDRIEADVEDVVVTVLRAGTIATAAIVAASALVVTVLIVANVGTIVSLYEGSQLGVVGGIAVTIAQIAYMPNLVLWAASWLTGAGFTLGTGAPVSPTDTVAGPIPGIPVLGALPATELTFGFVGLLVPVLAGFLSALAVRPALLDAIGRRSRILWLSVAGVGIGAVAGIETGLLAWFSHGAGGPGRFVDVGPNGFLTGALTAGIVAVAALIGMASGPSDRARGAERPGIGRSRRDR